MKTARPNIWCLIGQQANEEEIERILYQITLATPQNTNLINNIYLQLGNLYYENYELEKAFAAYTFILDKPENDNNETLKAELFNNIGVIYEKKSNYNTALNYHKKSIIILKKVLTLQHDTTKRVFNNYKNALNKAVKIVPNDIIAAHIAFIQAEFSEYL